MKRVTGFVALLVALTLCAPAAQARNEALFLSIHDAMKSEEAQSQLEGNIKLYFGDQAHPAIEKTLSQGVVASKKSGIRGKDETDACHSAFVASLAQLQKRADKEGGNAVVNIESYYKKSAFKSKDKYECHAGRSKTVVMLKGDVVTLKK
ncbi:MAG: excinuclease ATPase subunit [Betaproteobacteria bacterium]|nr:excinuclease ATPase subunit [Betaproteobacteria bacterium]